MNILDIVQESLLRQNLEIGNKVLVPYKGSSSSNSFMLVDAADVEEVNKRFKDYYLDVTVEKGKLNILIDNVVEALKSDGGYGKYEIDLSRFEAEECNLEELVKEQLESIGKYSDVDITLNPRKKLSDYDIKEVLKALTSKFKEMYIYSDSERVNKADRKMYLDAYTSVTKKIKDAIMKIDQDLIDNEIEEVIYERGYPLDKDYYFDPPDDDYDVSRASRFDP